MGFFNWKIFGLGFFSALAIAGVFWYSCLPPAQNDCITDYKFINPEPGCEVTEEKLLASLDNMKTNIEKEINSAVSANRAQKVSVFFRGLATRRWFGIDEKKMFFGASLYKLPVAIAYFKISEYDPSILSKQIKYDVGKSFNDLLDIKPSRVLENGKTYTISDLIEHMMIYSDNDAANILYDLIDKKFLTQVFSDFDIRIPKDQNDGNTINVKSYSAILRSLYNASYLSRANSEKVLVIMSRAEFKEGIAAGVPEGILVAHKFGENIRETADDPATLNDCGIIYKKDRPYILCVMTQGNDMDSLKGVIKNISQIAFKNIDY